MENGIMSSFPNSSLIDFFLVPLEMDFDQNSWNVGSKP